MPPNSYLDPFNERANDSFFGQLPKHFDTSTSFYGGIPAHNGAWQAAMPSKKKSSSLSQKKQKSKSTPSRSSQENEASIRGQRQSVKAHEGQSPSSSSYTPKQLQELPVKTANSKWQSISHSSHESGDTALTEALSLDSFHSRSSKGRSKSSKRETEKAREQGSRKGTPKKLKKLKNTTELPPAFQLVDSLSKKKYKQPSTDKPEDKHEREARASASKDRARSNERRRDREPSSSKRERSLSLGRLKKSKEDARARMRNQKRSEEEENFSNSLPSMGYRGRVRNKHGSGHEDHESCSTVKASAPRTRSRSIGRLNTEKHRRRQEERESQVGECGEMELASSLPSKEHRRSREQRKAKPERSSSVGALSRKTNERAGRERSRPSRNSEAPPKRSNSLGALHKKTRDQSSRDREHSDGVVKNKSRDQPRRSNSLGPIHKKSRSMRNSDDPSSTVSSRRRESMRPSSNNEDEAKMASKSTGAAFTPNAKARKKSVSKPATSSMDGIFASSSTPSQIKKEVASSSAPINAVHGNKSALAAWRAREAAKEEGTPVRIRSKASIAAGYEAAAGISPRRPTREDLLQIPSLFTSPPLIAKKKVKSKSSPTTSATRKTTEKRKSDLPPAFRGLSCRPKQSNSMQNSQGTPVSSRKYAGRGER